MSKWTPDTFSKRKFGDTKTTSIYASGWSRPIAAVRGRDAAEQEANADLFAAAPIMYTALLLARNALRGNENVGQTLDYVERAIARAEGKQPETSLA